MLKKYLISICLLSFFCCKKDDTLIKDYDLDRVKQIEKNFVLDSVYPIGDVRRYGIYPDSVQGNNLKHPFTGKYKIQSLLDLAEDSKLTINFPEGNYGLNILIDSRDSINLHFNKSGFNLVHITNANGKESSNINLRGSIIVYKRFGTFSSSNIVLDSLIIKTNKLKNLDGQGSKGCHIYKGTKNLSIGYLEIEDLASGSSDYAALAIDGLRDNPTNIKIDEVLIKSSDRHGAYITGTNNIFNKITIQKYAQGSTEGMSGMQDADKGEEKVLSGLWINRCNSCEFNEVNIITKNSKVGYPLKLDEGNAAMPTLINELSMDVAYTDSIILDDVLTNVLVKKITRIQND